MRHDRTALALPLLLWFIASFLLLGDLGKWFDDYGAHVRNPDTGSYTLADLFQYHWPTFWRPLHIQTVYTLQTVLWHHDWVNHLVSALAHGLCALLLFRLCTALRIARLPSACAALLFLCAPTAYEAVFWPATIGAPLGLATFLWCALITIRYARDPSPPTSRAQLLRLTAITMLAFAVPCWYEQPATTLAIIPLLVVAASPARPEPQHPLLTPALAARALAPTLLAAGACALYLALLVVSNTKDTSTARGSVASFTPIAELPDKADQTLRQIGKLLTPEDFLLGSLRNALHHLAEHPLTILPIALVPIAGFFWVRTRTRSTTPMNTPADATPPPDSALLLACALIALLLSFLPLLAIRTQWLTPRMLYTPIFSIAFALSIVLDSALRALRHHTTIRRWAERTLATTTVLLCTLGALCLVGIQSALQSRSRLDQQQLAQLRALVPDPAPGSVFVPLQNLDTATDTGVRGFDLVWLGVFESPWSANTMVKHTFADSTLGALHCHRFRGTPAAFTRTALTANERPAHHITGGPVPIDRVIPFRINRAGDVEIISSLTVPSLSSDAFTIRPHQTQPLDHAVHHTLPIEGLDALARPGPWLWRHSDDPVAFAPINSWGQTLPAVPVHPRTPAINTSHHLRTTLPPHARTRRIHCFVAYSDKSLPAQLASDGVTITLTTSPPGSNQQTTLASHTLLPEHTRTLRAWTRFTATVPPNDTPMIFRVSITPNGSPHSDWILLAQPMIETLDSSSDTASPAGVPLDGPRQPVP